MSNEQLSCQLGTGHWALGRKHTQAHTSTHKHTQAHTSTHKHTHTHQLSRGALLHLLRQPFPGCQLDHRTQMCMPVAHWCLHSQLCGWQQTTSRMHFRTRQMKLSCMSQLARSRPRLQSCRSSQPRLLWPTCCLCLLCPCSTSSCCMCLQRQTQAHTTSTQIFQNMRQAYSHQCSFLCGLTNRVGACLGRVDPLQSRVACKIGERDRARQQHIDVGALDNVCRGVVHRSRPNSTHSKRNPTARDTWGVDGLIGVDCNSDHIARTSKLGVVIGVVGAQAVCHVWCNGVCTHSHGPLFTNQ